VFTAMARAGVQFVLYGICLVYGLARRDRNLGQTKPSSGDGGASL